MMCTKSMDMMLETKMREVVASMEAIQFDLMMFLFIPRSRSINLGTQRRNMKLEERPSMMYCPLTHLGKKMTSRSTLVWEIAAYQSPVAPQSRHTLCPTPP